jgi:hypothetical protein
MLCGESEVSGEMLCGVLGGSSEGINVVNRPGWPECSDLT